MISSEKVKEILKLVIEKEKDMVNDKDTYKKDKDKEKEIKKIIERMVKIDEI